MTTYNTPRLGIIGTVGVPARYGGFETLAHQLVMKLREQFRITVYNSSKAYPSDDRPASWKGARLVWLPLKANGIQSIFYDLISMIHAIFFCDVLLVLGVSGCFFLPFIKLFTRKRVLVNVDGLEWRRPKWNGMARAFLRWSEAVAVRWADEIITDNAAIQKYVFDCYGRNSRLIAYGADHVEAVEKTHPLAKQYSFMQKDYAFKVCRIEPENMLDMILEAFAQQELPLVLVGNWNHSAYGQALRIRYQNYTHLHLLDPIYDPTTLNLLRSNCTVYVHGHSAGGTNPSLVEAMYLGLPILAYGVIYNRITTDHEGTYFDTTEELTSMLNTLAHPQLTALGARMQYVANRQYTWDHIAQAYATAALGRERMPVPSFNFELPLALRRTFEPISQAA